MDLKTIVIALAAVLASMLGWTIVALIETNDANENEMYYHQGWHAGRGDKDAFPDANP